MRIPSNLSSLKQETIFSHLADQKVLILSIFLMAVTTMAITTRGWMQAKATSGVQQVVSHTSYSFAYFLKPLTCMVLAILFPRNKIKKEPVVINDLLSPMMGKCTVFVKEEEKVLKGKCLFEMEVMKMFYRVNALKEGKVVKIFHSDEIIAASVIVLQIAE